MIVVMITEESKRKSHLRRLLVILSRSFWLPVWQFLVSQEIVVEKLDIEHSPKLSSQAQSSLLHYQSKS